MLTRLHWLLDRWLLELLLVRPMDYLMERGARWYRVLLRHALAHPSRKFPLPRSGEPASGASSSGRNPMVIPTYIICAQGASQDAESEQLSVFELLEKVQARLGGMPF